MSNFNIILAYYLKTKSAKSLDQASNEAFRIIEDSGDKKREKAITSLFKEGLIELIKLDASEQTEISRERLCSILVYCAKSLQINDHSEIILKFIKESLDAQYSSCRIKANKFLSNILSTQITIDDLINFKIIDSFKNFFNRKTHIDELLIATKALESIFAIEKGKEQILPLLIDSLFYCVTHLDYGIISSGVIAARNLITDNVEIADELMNLFFFDDVYAQFRLPNNKLKAEILKFFTKAAYLAPKIRKYIGEHPISERISAFICHYDYDVCIECINLLEALDYSVQKGIENKYIITLILHVSMSTYKFKIKSFNLLEKYLYKADASQVRVISDEGYIRPFLTLAVDPSTNNNDKERILKLLEFLIDEYDILKIRIVQFDFDHAHNAEDFSCVNQLIQLMEGETSNIRIMASHILDELRKYNIINHMHQE